MNINFYLSDKIATGVGYIHYRGGCYVRDRMVVGFTTTMQSVSITTDVVSSNLDQGEVSNIM